MLSMAAAPSIVSLPSSARRAALPLRGSGPTRLRPAHQLRCQPAAAVADAMATGIGVGLTLRIIHPSLLLCGQAIARRLLPQLAERHGWEEADSDYTTLVAFAGAQHDASDSNLYYAGVIFAGAALYCLVQPTLSVLGREVFRRR